LSISVRNGSKAFSAADVSAWAGADAAGGADSCMAQTAPPPVITDDINAIAKELRINNKARYLQAHHNVVPHPQQRLVPLAMGRIG
jgi:hypothetical protein